MCLRLDHQDKTLQPWLCVHLSWLSPAIVATIVATIVAVVVVVVVAVVVAMEVAVAVAMTVQW